MAVNFGTSRHTETHILEKRTKPLVTNDPQIKTNGNLDSDTKKLFSGAIANYLKQLYSKSGMKGNPTKADTINHINTILDHLPTAAKNYLSSYVNDLKSNDAKSRKQLIDNFIQLLLKEAFKNRHPYSQQDKEIINNKVNEILKKALENTSKDNSINQKEASANQQTKTVTTSNKDTTAIANNTTDQQDTKDQKAADDKLKEIQEANKLFDKDYHDFIKKLHLIGSFLNLAKSYEALTKSTSENKFYSDSTIKMQDDDPKQQKEVANILFNILNNPGSKDFKYLEQYLISQHISPQEASNLKNYFLGPGGVFPKDAKSLLTLIQNPKQATLFTGGKKVSEILNFRFLVLKGLTKMQKKSADSLYDPLNPENTGKLLDRINKTNTLMSEYNDILKKHPNVIGSKFDVKLTFNEATGGFVMFSTFKEEYQLGESDRQAATLQGEGYNRTLAYLEEIASGLTAGIDSKTDEDTSDEKYLSHLTQKELDYLGGLRLYKDGKTIAEDYFSKNQKNSGSISRGNAKAINSKLHAIIKAYQDKNQEVSITLQDTTEKRNAAATTLSKFLDKMYDVYKLIAQF